MHGDRELEVVREALAELHEEIEAAEVDRAYEAMEGADGGDDDPLEPLEDGSPYGDAWLADRYESGEHADPLSGRSARSAELPSDEELAEQLRRLRAALVRG